MSSSPHLRSSNMNSIKKILDINDRELASNTPDAASWHADYADTSYVYIGNLDRNLKEADILTIFSQYGNPTHINLIKDNSGTPKGFCYLKYEDQRSCVLAVDNFNGTLIYERPLKVDHVYYKLAKGQKEDDFKVKYPEVKPQEFIEAASMPNGSESIKVPSTAMDDDDFEDPMANMVKPVTDNSERRKHSREISERSRKKDKRHRSDKLEGKVTTSYQHEGELTEKLPKSDA